MEVEKIADSEDCELDVDSIVKRLLDSKFNAASLPQIFINPANIDTFIMKPRVLFGGEAWVFRQYYIKQAGNTNSHTGNDAITTSMLSV